MSSEIFSESFHLGSFCAVTGPPTEPNRIVSARSQTSMVSCGRWHHDIERIVHQVLGGGGDSAARRLEELGFGEDALSGLDPLRCDVEFCVFLEDGSLAAYVVWNLKNVQFIQHAQ